MTRTTCSLSISKARRDAPAISSTTASSLPPHTQHPNISIYTLRPLADSQLIYRSLTMLLSSTHYSHMPSQHYATHAPIRSSPLRERSANAGAGLFDFSMALQDSENQPNQSQRAFKANPVLQTRDAATKRRRDMFFKRVQNNREDKKWESRGEQVHQETRFILISMY